MTAQERYNRAEKRLVEARDALLREDRRLRPQVQGPWIAEKNAVYEADPAYLTARERFVAAVERATRLWRRVQEGPGLESKRG